MRRYHTAQLKVVIRATERGSLMEALMRRSVVGECVADDLHDLAEVLKAFMIVVQ